LADIHVSNAESDAQLKSRAMQYILIRICRKYIEKNDPTFTQEDVKKELRGLGPEYVDLNIRDLFRGSGLIDISDDLELTLNENGRSTCKNGALQN
jgi:hypothetical protein